MKRPSIYVGRHRRPGSSDRNVRLESGTDITVAVHLGDVPGISLVTDSGSAFIHLSDHAADSIVKHAHHVARFGYRKVAA